MLGYGDVAVGAVHRFASGAARNLRMAWAQEAEQTFGAGSRAEKVCPRTAFLALCAEGVVKGVPAGDYVDTSLPNCEHALSALSLLREGAAQFESGRALWQALGVSKAYNQQLDVVLALWRAGLVARQ
jgi:hypothetical protein